MTFPLLSWSYADSRYSRARGGRRRAVARGPFGKHAGTAGPFGPFEGTERKKLGVPAFWDERAGRTAWAGLAPGLVQAAARHVGAGTAARAAYHASVRVETERLARPLAPGDSEGAAAAQAKLLLVPAAELVEAVSLDARALSYAIPE